MKLTTYILSRTCGSVSRAKITLAPCWNTYPSTAYPVRPLMFDSASVSLRSMIFTGCLACVPMLYNLVPPRNSMIGRLARWALSNAAVVLL